AVIVGQKAIIGRMAKPSRRGEVAAIEQQLKRYLSIKHITAPATLEGGDVIHLPENLICGITQRTNVAGVIQLQDIINIPIITIDDKNIIHLKSHITHLNKNIIVAIKAITSYSILDPFEVLVIPDDEAYAANTLTVNDTVLIAKGHPKTQAMIKKAGFDTVVLDMSEFEKCDGALTCLSLFF
ncbi:MAG: arginine deiminase family protein, partial [Candidatus Thorarchaeota archaeon]